MYLQRLLQLTGYRACRLRAGFTALIEQFASTEVDTFSLEGQLEGTRITRKGDPHSQFTPPPPKMVTAGRQCASSSTITPTKICSANLYRPIKRRVGHAQGNTPKGEPGPFQKASDIKTIWN